MCCFLEERKLNDSLWILLKCTNVWHVEDSAHFLLWAADLGGSLAVEKPGAFQLSLKRINWFWVGFFLVIHGKMLHFWKRSDQQGWEWNILLVISPSPLEQGQQTWRVPFCSVSGTKPSSRGWQGTMVVDSWCHSYRCPTSWGHRGGTTYR